MPSYRVRFNGKGICLPMDGGVAVGFFATRAVRARDSDEAVERARSLITNDWTVGKYADWNQGVAPSLHVDDVLQSSWLSDLFLANDGHTFYPADACEDEA